MSIRCNHSIYSICENCEPDLYAKAFEQRGGHGETHGESVTQVAVPESAHTAQRAACEEQRQGTRDALRAASHEAGPESAGQANAPSYGAHWASVLVTDAALAAGLHQLRTSLDLSRDLIAELEDDGNLHAVAAAVYRAMVLASGMSAGTAETQSGSGPQPASPTSQSEGTPNPDPGPPGVRS
jgi:hypothetical protein